MQQYSICKRLQGTGKRYKAYLSAILNPKNNIGLKYICDASSGWGIKDI